MLDKPIAHFQIGDRVAVPTLDDPPVDDAVERRGADPAARFLVLVADRCSFTGGSYIGELGRGGRQLRPAQLSQRNRIEERRN
jgi:hypothetical protein